MGLITSLLAELPALETAADGVNLGLQLADGTQIHFASTARLATFLYSVAVQQMQATSFVTDNYNLDMQWLNLVDQPLLDEAVYWTERATAEASIYPERTVEDNVQANLALQIAAEDPSSRQNMTVTIHNDATGNPTQITVYAGGGSTIHDVAPGVLQEVLGGISTVLNFAALVTGNAYLYYAAAVLDSAQAGEDFSQGQILPGILSLAQAVAAGITANAGGTPGTTAPPLAAQVINAAVQGVGGIYGVVQSAENGNALGIVTGALEAAAAGATGIGLLPGQDTQTLNLIAGVLGASGIVGNVANDFASGNLEQGLVDSLNLYYLPNVANSFSNYLNSTAQVQQPLQMDAQAFAAASGDPAPNIDIPNFADIVGAAMASPPPSTNGGGEANVNMTVAQVPAGSLSNVVTSAGSDGVGIVVTQGGTTYVTEAAPANSGNGSTTPTPDTTAPSAGLAFSSVMWFLNSAVGISSAEAATASGGAQMSLAAIETEVTLNNQSGVSNNFITAMIMQESGFHPNIAYDPNNPNSPIGLMQVTPSTFRFMQQQYPAQLGSFTVDELTDPAVNIQAGTAYLKYLLSGKDGGNLSAAIKDYGTGYYNALQAGASYLENADTGATTRSLYNAILQAK